MSNFAPLQKKQSQNNATPTLSSPAQQTESVYAGHTGHSISSFALSRSDGLSSDAEQQQASSLMSQQTAPESATLQLDTQTVGQPVTGEQRKNRTGLPDSLKTSIEDLSGYSLSDVRVHYNSSRPAEVGALAYTQGTQIHVGSGQEQHLAHEAWHVVQQKQGRVHPTTQVKGVAINDNAGLEQEADRMGRVVTGGGHTGGQVQTISVQQELSSPPPGESSSSPIMQQVSYSMQIIKIIVDQLGVEEGEVTPGASFTNDLGADSLDLVEMTMQLEKDFNMSIPDEEAETLTTVGKVIAYIEENAR